MLRRSSTAMASTTNSSSATDCYAGGRFDEIAKGAPRFRSNHGRDAADARRGPPQDLFAGTPDLARQRRGAPGAGRGHRRRGGAHRVRRRGRIRVEQSAFGGSAKLQWKVDWATRWVALGVDYEMAGKDLIDSVTHRARSPESSGPARPKVSITRCSSTRRARKSRSPRATASASRSGCATAASRA